MRRFCHSPGPSGARRSSVPRPMDSSSRRALARTAHAKPGRSQISVMTERRRRRPICGPFDLLGPLRTHHAEIQANRSTTAAVASYVHNPGRSQISVMTERRRRRPIRESATCAGPQGPTMPSFRPIEPPQRPRRPPILKELKAWGAPRRRRGRFRGGLLLLLLYSTLLYSTSILLYSTSTGQVN